MHLGNPRHTYHDKNLREASVKIGVPSWRLSCLSFNPVNPDSDGITSTPSTYSEISEEAFQRPPLKTVQSPVIVYVYNFFEICNFSDFTLNTLKLATFSLPYV